MSELAQLSKSSVIVADTGDIDAIRKHKPYDATTNPSLLMKAASLPQYQYLVDEAISYAKTFPEKQQVEEALDAISVNFGCEILKLVPGLVSTEVDARLSFKPKRTMEKARKLIKMYEAKGVSKDRILIKIAATWQGIKAAEQLEKEGIRCNLTLLFSKEAQAVACAEAGVTLISPFVGRTTDWYKKSKGVKEFAPHEDPGCILVKSIHDYYKKHGYKTIVMGASFRTRHQILELAGLDRFTISPELLQELSTNNTAVTNKLAPADGPPVKAPSPLDDRHFYMRMCRDACAIEKLHEGIRNFVDDTVKLEHIVKAKFGAKSKL